MKFKIGDYVRVISKCKYRGKIGKIGTFGKRSCWCTIRIKEVDNPILFHIRELKLISTEYDKEEL